MRSLSPAAFALAASLAGFATQADAQSGSASSTFLRTIQAQDRGPARTIEGLNNNVLASSRAQVPRTGVNNFLIQSSTATSGTGNSSSLTSFAPSGPARSSKPFANATRGSTISPYLNLFRDDAGFGGVDNYNTLVRPQLEQQRVNQQLQRQTQALNRRVQQISAQGAFQTRGSEQIMATGHTTGFRYYSHYYPAFNRRR